MNAQKLEDLHWISGMEICILITVIWTNSGGVNLGKITDFYSVKKCLMIIMLTATLSIIYRENYVYFDTFLEKVIIMVENAYLWTACTGNCATDEDLGLYLYSTCIGSGTGSVPDMTAPEQMLTLLSVGSWWIHYNAFSVEMLFMMTIEYMQIFCHTLERDIGMTLLIHLSVCFSVRHF